MSKSSGTWWINLPLSMALDRCKRNVRSCRRFARRMVSSICRHHNTVEVEKRKNVSHPFKIDSCQQLVELKEFINRLSIGDRVRVLCDDGVLVAEKISETQLKLIDCHIAS